MDPPSVSVIIAVKNGARFLAQALDSIVAQSYPPREIMVVDGGSTDGSDRIARSYPDVRWLRQTNDGFADAWNLGIEAARGEAIAFLDSDDWWAPRKLELQAAHLAAMPAEDCVIGLVKFVADNQAELPRGFRPNLLARNHVGYMPGAMLVRRQIFKRIGRFGTNWTITSDIDWFAQLKDHGIGLGVLPEIVLFKRVHQGNLSFLSAGTPAYRRELLELLHASVLRQRTAATDKPR